MRVSSRSLLGVALVLLAGVSIAPAQQPAPEAIPDLDVIISFWNSPTGSVELIGRDAPGAVYCTVGVQDSARHVVYVPSVTFALSPGSSERVTKEVSGLTFSLASSSSSRIRLVRADVVVSRGSRVLARYHSSSDLPSPGTDSR
jgi:hypothetical protein